jgi:hypothetical protein
MQYRASQHTVYSVINAALHAEQAEHAKSLKEGFLNSAKEFCGRIADHHVLLPPTVHSGRLHEGQLRSVEHNYA